MSRPPFLDLVTPQLLFVAISTVYNADGFENCRLQKIPSNFKNMRIKNLEVKREMSNSRASIRIKNLQEFRYFNEYSEPLEISKIEFPQARCIFVRRVP